MPVAFRKGPRNEPWGSSACARSSTMSPSSEPVREARARVVVRGALSERAARGVAVQPSRFQVADHDPLPAEIDAPDQAAARVQRAAPRYAVERLIRFRIGPGSLDKYAGGDRAAAVDSRGETQIGLRAAIAVDELAPAREQRDRHRAELLIPFDVQADRSAGLDVRDVVTPQEIRFAREASSLDGELRPEIEPLHELSPDAALEDPLGGAREPGLSVISHRRNQIGSLCGRAGVRGPRAYACAYPRAFRQGALAESRARNDQQKSGNHASRSHARSVPQPRRGEIRARHRELRRAFRP